MRIREIISEAAPAVDPMAAPADPNMADPTAAPAAQGPKPDSETDRALAHGYDDIRDVLATNRNQLLSTHQVPQMPVQKIVDEVNAIRGDRSFRFSDLDDAIKSGQFEDLIDGNKIEADAHTGVNYILFKRDEVDAPSIAGREPVSTGGGSAGGAKPGKNVVSQMASRAATK